jgi:membrane associated rhomboid family serine protease
MLLPLRDDNPTRRTAVITIILIMTNAAVFIYLNFLAPHPPEYYIYAAALIPWEITHFQNASIPVRTASDQTIGYFHREIPPFQSLITSMFMHGSLMHLLGNMLFLWIFGNNIEDSLGKIRFLLFYLLAGIAASLIHTLFHPLSFTPVLGASGAISGVMGAYLVLYPRARIHTLVFLFILVTTVDIPAAVFLIIWFLFQFFYAGGGEGVAWLAHVGGFIMGILLLRLLQNRKPARVEFMK